ncbi:MAG: energy transducer TonB [Prevotellaceae bacterium]|jgi:TonB family protein|nr:energy transducer TonB [Prevotellaceae bacterium]
MDTQKHPVNRERFDKLFSDEHRTFGQWIADNRTGIYVSVIIHLIVFVLLAGNKLYRLHVRNTYMIELIHQREEKREENPKEAEEREKEEINKEIDRMLKSSNIKLPNMAVNLEAKGSESGQGSSAEISFFSKVNSASLKEKREKEQTKTEERNVRKPAGEGDVVENSTTAGGGEAYKGPSVVSFLLAGRDVISLPVPAYKCRNGGDVTVIIEVNRLGYVIDASVENPSGIDECIREASLNAARRARFSRSKDPNNQKGNIVYRFVSQY